MGDESAGVSWIVEKRPEGGVDVDWEKCSSIKGVIRRRDKYDASKAINPTPYSTANSIPSLPKLVASGLAPDHSQVTNTILTQWTKPATKKKSLDEMVFLPHMRVAHCKNRKKRKEKTCVLHIAHGRNKTGCSNACRPFIRDADETPCMLSCPERDMGSLEEVVHDTTTCGQEDAKPPPLVGAVGGAPEQNLVAERDVATLLLAGSGSGSDEGVESRGGQHVGRFVGNVQRHQGRPVFLEEIQSLDLVVLVDDNFVALGRVSRLQWFFCGDLP
jgi:hypothetical protein